MNIEDSHDYPFHYMSMVVDANDSASVWMNGHYELYWVPTNYFDGGHRVVVGANNEDLFRDRIETAGAREVMPLDLEISVTWLGSATMSIHVELSQVSTNEAPLDPGAPTGSDLAVTDMEYSFSSVTSDPNEDQLYYMWDFGDEVTDWLGPYASGEEVNTLHTWTTPGIYDVKVKAKDDQEAESQWSMPLSIDVKLCGDTDPSGGVDIDDVVYVVMYVFAGGPAPVPLEVGNVDCFESVDIDDAVYLVMYIFAFGPVPCAQCN